jgi:hypothetical protein
MAYQYKGASQVKFAHGVLQRTHVIFHGVAEPLWLW